MDTLDVVLLAGLLCFGGTLVSAWLFLRSRERTSERQLRERRQAAREALAAKRIAENGGKALSFRFEAKNAPQKYPERST